MQKETEKAQAPAARIMQNRKQRRAKTHSTRTHNELFFQLGIVRRNWRELLDRVEAGVDRNLPHQIGRQIPAQVYLLDRLSEIAETEAWLKSFNRLPPRHLVAARVNKHQLDIATFAAEVKSAKENQQGGKQ